MTKLEQIKERQEATAAYIANGYGIAEKKGHMLICEDIPWLLARVEELRRIALMISIGGCSHNLEDQEIIKQLANEAIDNLKGYE